MLNEPATLPQNFFQTTSGRQPYSMSAQCKQCPRAFADAPNQASSATGCATGYFCNSAAVCAPCDRDDFCGQSCGPCRGSEPYCLPNLDEPTQATCVQCRDTPDGPTGQLCVGNRCITPNLLCPDRPFQVTRRPAQVSARALRRHPRGRAVRLLDRRARFGRRRQRHPRFERRRAWRQPRPARRAARAVGLRALVERAAARTTDLTTAALFKDRRGTLCAFAPGAHPIS